MPSVPGWLTRASLPCLFLDGVLRFTFVGDLLCPLFSGLHPEGSSLCRGLADYSAVVVLRLQRAHRPPKGLIKLPFMGPCPPPLKFWLSEPWWGLGICFSDKFLGTVGTAGPQTVL